MASIWSTLRRVIVVFTCTAMSSRRASASISHGAIEAALPAAKGVVRRGVGAVEADAQPPHAGLPRALEGLERGQRRGRGRQRHLQPGRHGVADQLEQVGPLQRIAAGQHQHRPARKAGDLIEQGLGLVGRKLVRVAAFPGPTPGSACTPGRRPA